MYAVLIVLIALAYLAVGGFVAGWMRFDPTFSTGSYVFVVLLWPLAIVLVLGALALHYIGKPFYHLGEWVECNLWFAIRKLKKRK